MRSSARSARTMILLRNLPNQSCFSKFRTVPQKLFEIFSTCIYVMLMHLTLWFDRFSTDDKLFLWVSLGWFSRKKIKALVVLLSLKVANWMWVGLYFLFYLKGSQCFFVHYQKAQLHCKRWMAEDRNIYKCTRFFCTLTPLVQCISLRHFGFEQRHMSLANTSSWLSQC